MDTENNGGKNYIQVGAGAGDQDSRAHFRDGFSEYVKRLLPSEIRKIVLVEPNPANIEGLSICWKEYPQSEIYQIGIVPKSELGNKIQFFIALQDAPHYQVASINSEHVLSHYPDLKLEDLVGREIVSKDLESFILECVGLEQVELLSLDVEGIDAEIILDTNLADLNVNLISFEHLHLGSKTAEVIDKMVRSGYQKIGIGVDHNGYDWLYQKIENRS